MSDYYNAFEISPVPEPIPGAVAPEPYRGIYGMPMFVTVPTADLAASEKFWCEGLGFFNLFDVPGRMVHLRRWAFQDVLLVASEVDAQELPASSVSFACVLDEIAPLEESCAKAWPGSTVSPRHTPWNSVELEVHTPENVRVIFTAAKPFDPASQEMKNLAEIGITPPEGV